MAKNKVFYSYLFLSLTLIFLSGCVYMRHMDDVMFLKGLESSQKEMQAELVREERLYTRLKKDIDRGYLKKQLRKGYILARYGKPALCRPVEGRADTKETWIYRQPSGGVLAQIILLNFDPQDKLNFWQIQNP